MTFSKVLITGASGTVGSALRRALEQRGATVAAWDRQAVPPSRFDLMEDYLRGIQPEGIYHLATSSRPVGLPNESRLVNVEWTGRLGELSAKLEIPIIFSSTVMVFSEKTPGPYTPDTPPDAPEGYGYEKRKAEELLREKNPQARIARLSWQIGETAGSNNMFDFLTRQMAENGRIAASASWLPACAFLGDTAAALLRLLQKPPGIYLLDSNRKWSFLQIVEALKEKHQTDWRIAAQQEFVYDQRMLDERMEMPPLSDRLPSLR